MSSLLFYFLPLCFSRQFSSSHVAHQLISLHSIYCPFGTFSPLSGLWIPASSLLDLFACFGLPSLLLTPACLTFSLTFCLINHWTSSVFLVSAIGSSLCYLVWSHTIVILASDSCFNLSSQSWNCVWLNQVFLTNISSPEAPPQFDAVFSCFTIWAVSTRWWMVPDIFHTWHSGQKVQFLDEPQQHGHTYKHKRPWLTEWMIWLDFSHWLSHCQKLFCTSCFSHS